MYLRVYILLQVKYFLFEDILEYIQIDSDDETAIINWVLEIIDR